MDERFWRDIKAMRRAVECMTEGIDMGQLATAAEQVRLTASAFDSALLPAATQIASFGAELARAAEPHRSAIADIEATRRAVECMTEGIDMGQLVTAAEQVRLAASAFDSALLPTATQIASFGAELARAVEPYRSAVASVSAWEASLTARMTALKIPWVLRDDPNRSITGFARLSRLSDAVHMPSPFSEPIRELVAHELGTSSVEAHPDQTASGRDAAAVKAGFNPELIGFPSSAYAAVVFAAGFNLHLPSLPPPQAIESSHPNAVFDPMHGRVLTELEQRLRYTVEKRLSGLVGQNWIRHRVSEEARKRWLKRQKQDRDDGRPVFPLIQYADFMDLADVISRSDNWDEAFGSIFRNKEDFSTSLRRLKPVRNAIAHSRPLGKSDVLVLLNEATRIFSALKIRFLS